MLKNTTTAKKEAMSVNIVDILNIKKIKEGLVKYNPRLADVENYTSILKEIEQTTKSYYSAWDINDIDKSVESVEIIFKIMKTAVANCMGEGSKNKCFDVFSLNKIFIKLLLMIIKNRILETCPESIIQAFDKTRMFSDVDEFVSEILGAVFKHYKIYEEVSSFKADNRAECKEQAKKLCEKVRNIVGEDWYYFGAQDRYLIQFTYSMFVHELKVLNHRESCESLNICDDVLSNIFSVELVPYLLMSEEFVDETEHEMYAEILDIMDKQEESYIAEEYDYYGNKDEFEEQCMEYYDALVDGFSLKGNMSTRNRRAVIKKAFDVYVCGIDIIDKEEFAEDFGLYNNDTGDFDCEILEYFDI